MKVLVSLSVALISTTSWASTCSYESQVFPRDGSIKVPTNVVVRVFNWGGSFAATLSANGSVVATTQRRDPDSLLVLTPDAPLLLRTEYTVDVTASTPTLTRFTTGDGADTTPPSTPSIDVVDTSTTNAWSLTVSGAEDEATPSDDVLLLVQPGGLLRRGDAVLRWGWPCTTNFAKPDGANDFDVTLQAMDWAGNVSEVSAPKTITSRGCSAAPGGALVMLLLTLINRRRS